MVRLKPKKGRIFYFCKFPSQFHYGSIKTTVKNGIEVYSPLSQFHYGSIKTKLSNGYILKFWWSQFHYGSIKTEKNRY